MGAGHPRVIRTDNVEEAKVEKRRVLIVTGAKILSSLVRGMFPRTQSDLWACCPTGVPNVGNREIPL